MSRFSRRGHYRTNANGATFWVESHMVDRSGYSSISGYVTPVQPSIDTAYGHTSGLKASHRHLALPESTKSAHPLINPNASCPVCGAHVFFYRSESGGAVFFDELGPPWPKHPCIVGSSDIREIEHVERQSNRVAYNWQRLGWKPLSSLRIGRSADLRGDLITGFSLGKRIDFVTPLGVYGSFLKLGRPFANYMQLPSGEYKVFLFWMDADHSMECMSVLETSRFPAEREPVSGAKQLAINDLLRSLISIPK